MTARYLFFIYRPAKSKLNYMWLANTTDTLKTTKYFYFLIITLTNIH